MRAINQLSLSLAAIFSIMILQSNATAGTLIYRGSNPNITPGAPYNPNQAAATDRLRPYNPRSIRVGDSEGEVARRSVISTATALLTSSSSTDGRVNFGDGSFADYSTSGGVRTVTITNRDGTSTTISFPI